MKKFLLFAGIFCTLFSSCKKEEDVIQLPLLPLNIDNKWTYADSTFNYVLNTIRTDTVELQYKYYTEKNGYKGYSRIPIDTNEPASILNVDNDGNLIQYYISDSLNFKTIVLKKSARLNETWKFKEVTFTGTFDNIAIIETEVKCVAVDTLIKTPAGNFTCTGYAYTPDEGVGLLNVYYAENIGLVLYQYENSDVYRKRLLIKYELK